MISNKNHVRTAYVTHFLRKIKPGNSAFEKIQPQNRRERLMGGKLIAKD